MLLCVLVGACAFGALVACSDDDTVDEVDGATTVAVRETDGSAGDQSDAGSVSDGEVTGLTLTITAPAELAGTYDTAAIPTAEVPLCGVAGSGGFWVSFVQVGTPTAELPPSLALLSMELIAQGGADSGPTVANAHLVTPPDTASDASVVVEFVDELSGSFSAADGEPALEGSWSCTTG